MTGTTQPPDERPAADVGLSGHLLSLLASLASYLSARFELAGLEGKDAVGVFIKVAFALVLALIFLCFGYAFLWIGLIVLLASLCHLHWGWLVFGSGVLHLFAMAGCFFAVRRLGKKPIFTATLEEFRKDQEWLKSQK